MIMASFTAATASCPSATCIRWRQAPACYRASQAYSLTKFVCMYALAVFLVLSSIGSTVLCLPDATPAVAVSPNSNCTLQMIGLGDTPLDTGGSESEIQAGSGGGASYALFEHIVRAGQWECALEIVRLLEVKVATLSSSASSLSDKDKGGHSAEVQQRPTETLRTLRSMLDLEQRRIVAELTALKLAIDVALTNDRAPHIVPAFQWCQSATHVFLNVKFAHKLDAPATLNVEADTVDLQENRIRVIASSSKVTSKSFSLEIPLFAAILPQESTYSMASVGRMSITLKKSKAATKWPKLVSKSFDVNKQLGKSVMHFWHELHEQYAKELDALDDDAEEDADDDEDDKKKKRKSREKKEKDRQREKEKEKEKEKGKEESDSGGSGGAKTDSPTKDATPATTTTATADVTSNTASTASVDTPAATTDQSPPPPSPPSPQQKKQQQLLELETSHKSDLASIDAEGKRRKRDLDFDLIEAKRLLDMEMASKKKIAVEAYNLAIKQIDSASLTDTGSSNLASDGAQTQGKAVEL